MQETDPWNWQERTRLQRGMVGGYRLTTDPWSPGLALWASQGMGKQVAIR